MHISLDRRTFLKQAALASVVLGFPFLGRPSSACGAVLFGALMTQALDRMKKTNKPGLVIIVPSDAAAAKKLTDELSRALSAESPQSTDRVLGQCVLVCLPEAEVDKRFKDRKDTWSAILIDADARLIEPIEPAAKAGADKTGLLAEADRLLHEDGAKRLKPFAAAQEAALSREHSTRLKDAMSDLTAEDPAERAKALDRLVQLGPAAPALLSLQSQQSDLPEVRRGVASAFYRMLAVCSGAECGTGLPFGAEWVQDPANVFPGVNACMGCGKAVARPQAKRFLRLYTGNES